VVVNRGKNHIRVLPGAMTINQKEYSNGITEKATINGGLVT